MKIQDIYNKKEAVENSEEVNEARQLRELAKDNFNRIYSKLDREVKEMKESYLNEMVELLILYFTQLDQPLLEPNTKRSTYSKGDLREIFFGYNLSDRVAVRRKQLEKVSVHARTGFTESEPLIKITYMVRSGDYKKKVEGTLDLNMTPSEAAEHIQSEVVRFLKKIRR